MYFVNMFTLVIFLSVFGFLNQYGLTPLHVAAHYDNQQVAMMLLDKGASPNATAKVKILNWLQDISVSVIKKLKPKTWRFLFLPSV